MQRLVLLWLCACTPVHEDTEAPIEAEPAASAPAVAIPHEPSNARGELGLDAIDVVPDVDTIFSCRGEIQHVAKSHRARLELRDDGTFELHFSDVDPDGGRSLWMLGTWHAERESLLLRPESGVQRAWMGDAHKHAHGEPSGYSVQEQDGVSTHERRLPVTVVDRRVTAIRIDEIGTRLYPQGGDEAKRCDPSDRNP